MHRTSLKINENAQKIDENAMEIYTKTNENAQKMYENQIAAQWSSMQRNTAQIAQIKLKYSSNAAIAAAPAIQLDQSQSTAITQL